MAILCRCSKKGKKECDRVVAKARQIITDEGWGEPDSFRTLMFAICEMGHVSIHGDQWFGIDVHKFDMETKEYFKLKRFECDDPMDGLYAAYLFLKEAKEELLKK